MTLHHPVRHECEIAHHVCYFALNVCCSVCCSVLRCAALCCSLLQRLCSVLHCVAACCSVFNLTVHFLLHFLFLGCGKWDDTHCNALQHTLQYTAILCNTLQHIATYTAAHIATHTANALQRTATHCNALQHIATHCTALRHTAPHCITLQHTAAHCCTLWHTASHCNTHYNTTYCKTSMLFLHHWFIFLFILFSKQHTLQRTIFFTHTNTWVLGAGSEVESEIVCCSVLQRVLSQIVCCSVLPRVLSEIVCCSVLQRVLPHSQHTPQRTIFFGPSLFRLPSSSQVHLFEKDELLLLKFIFLISKVFLISILRIFLFSFFLFSVDYFFQIGHVCGLYRKKKQTLDVSFKYEINERWWSISHKEISLKKGWRWKRKKSRHFVSTCSHVNEEWWSISIRTKD